MKIAFVFASLAFVTPALAQQQGPSPCARSATTIQMGGVDVDQLRCALQMSFDQINAMTGIIIDLRSRNVLLQADLAAAKAAQAPPVAPSTAPPTASKPAEPAK